jgi:integrase
VIGEKLEAEFEFTRGGPLRYQSVHEHWVRYCAAAGVDATLHQLRHTHPTELVNAGVSLATIRKRLGHRNLQATLRYAEQSDAVADAELRAWRRRVPCPRTLRSTSIHIRCFCGEYYWDP